MTDDVPNPPSFGSRPTGWLEPSLTRVLESCAREGAAAAILARRRLPTPEEAKAAVEASEFLAYQPCWETQLEAVDSCASDLVAAAVRWQAAMDDDPEVVYTHLRRWGEERRQLGPAGSSATRAYLLAMSTPALLALKCIVDQLCADHPHWDAV